MQLNTNWHQIGFT